MESLNQTLFLWLNAPAQPNDLLLTVAIFFAEQLIWAVPCLIGIGWLGGDEGIRKAMLVATVSGLFGLIINQLIGLAWSNPRPFMIGLGPRRLCFLPGKTGKWTRLAFHLWLKATTWA